LNELDESVTVATLPPFARVTPRQMVATVKIIPYAAPRTAVSRAIEVARSGNRPLVSVAPFKALKAGLVQTRLPGTRDKVLDKAVGTTGKRLTSLGSILAGAADGDIRALGAEGLRDAVTDATGAANHQHLPAAEIQFVHRSRSFFFVF
jgi:hypothetical protein